MNKGLSAAALAVTAAIFNAFAPLSAQVAVGNYPKSIVESSFGAEVPIITNADPEFPELEAWRVEREKQCEERKILRLNFTEWARLDSPELQRVFPNWRFAGIAYSESLHPEYKGPRILGLVLGSRVIHALDRKTGKIVHTFRGFDEEFTAMLAAAKMKAETLEDVSAIRKAYGLMERRADPESPPIKISDTTWRIPEQGYDESREEKNNLLGTEKFVIRHN